MYLNPKIGIAIASHNNLDVLKHSLPPIYNSNYYISIFDDNSTDKTEQFLKKHYQRINYQKGDGTNWWTGSISKAITECINAGCEYILSLNADVIIDIDTINRLVITSKENNNSVIASLVIKKDDPEQVAWAGSNFIKIPLLPIYTSKYVYKAGFKYKNVLKNIYEVDEVHGRGVMFHKSVFETCGMYDFKTFPHYGGDTDFSLSLRKKGIKLFVNPSCHVFVFFNNSGFQNTNNSALILRIFNYLFKRKNGEAIRVWWNLLLNHVPWYAVLPSFIFNISLNIIRKLQLRRPRE